MPPATPDQLWQRLEEFLDAVLPVAEAAGVTLAAHPDDPPLADDARPAAARLSAATLPAAARPAAQPGQRPRVLHRHARRNDRRRRLRGHRPIQPPGQAGLRPLPQRHRQSAPLPRDVRRRRRRRHAPRPADPQAEQLRRRDHSRPHAANDLRRPLARRHGLRPRLHASRTQDHRAIMNRDISPRRAQMNSSSARRLCPFALCALFCCCASSIGSVASAKSHTWQSKARRRN